MLINVWKFFKNQDNWAGIGMICLVIWSIGFAVGLSNGTESFRNYCQYRFNEQQDSNMGNLLYIKKVEERVFSLEKEIKRINNR